MPRLSISKLPRPKRRYRPSLHQEEFETRASSRTEDALRAKKLRSAKVLSSARVSQYAAQKLAAKLDRAGTAASVSASLASSTYLRTMRNRLGGALWKLVKKLPRQAYRTFTILTKKLIRTPEQLLETDARKLMAALRQDLNRAGAGKAGGALIAFLHGEFEPESGYFVLHFHGLAIGEMIDVVNRLRMRKKYKPSIRGKDGKPAIKRPIRISRKPLTNLPEPLTYLLKGYWPAKRIGAVGAEGETKRNRRHGRIKEPYHSEVLLWLDRWVTI